MPIEAPHDLAHDAAPRTHFAVVFPDLGVTFSQAYVKDVQLPADIKLGSVQQRQADRVGNYPAAPTMDDLVITFYEDVAATIDRLYHGWRKKVFNETKFTYGMPADYKKDIVVEIVNLENKVARKLRFPRGWPVSLTGMNFSVTSNEAVTPTITFKVENVLREAG